MPQRPRRITLAAHTKAGRALPTHKRSHNDLTAAEHAARLASYTADLVWLLDDKGHFRYASPSCLQILGYDPATLIGTPVVDLVHPADLTTLCAARDQVVATGTAQATVRYRHADGSWRWGETRGNVVSSRGCRAIVELTRDITERQQAEDALRASEDRYRRLVEYSPDPIAVHQVGRLVYLNDAAARLVGAPSPDVLVGRSILDFVHPDDHAQVLARARQTQEQGSPADLNEERFVRLDGEVIDVEVVALPTTYLGAPATQVIIRDITERKRAERAIRFLAHASAVLASSLDYPTTLANLARLAVPALADYCTIHMLDKNSQLQLLEAAHADPAKRELLWEQLKCDPADPQIFGLLSTALRTGQPQLAADLLPGPQPSIARDAPHLELREALRPQSAMVVPLRTRNRPLGIIMLLAAESGRRFEARDLALAQDLVDRAALAVDSAQHYAAEREAHIAAGRAAERVTGLQEITAALAAALTPAEVAKVIVDQGMRVLGANAGALVLLSADAQHLQIVRAVGFPAELIEAWQQFPTDAPLPIVDAVRSGAPVWLESRAAWLARYPQIAHTSPVRAPCARSAIPLRVEEHVIGALGFNFVDEREFMSEDQAYMLTLAGQCAQALERARLYEAERQARSAAEQALQLRDIFFSVAAHELKTPLTSLIGHAQLLQRRAHQEANLSERDQRSIDVVCGQASRLSQMVSALLDITRIEQGRLSIAPAPLNLVLLTRRVVDEMRPTLDLHTLEYSDEGEPLIVIADALRLEQVLQNLIGNAVKYSPAGGPIHVHLLRQGDMAAVAVSDLGIGVPQAALSQLFQRFYRADNVDEQQITGMGIGLYVVKEIVTLHGGTLAVDSTEGQGSTFTFYLPLHPAAERR